MDKFLLSFVICFAFLSGCGQKDTDLQRGNSRERDLGSYNGGSKEPQAWQLRFNAHILDKDEDQRIFQLRVINQKPRECTMHQERNLLFGLAMFDDNLLNFEREYARMLDNDLFEALALLMVCEIEYGSDRRMKIPKVNETGIRRNPQLKEFIAENSNFSEYLPATADKNIDRIIEVAKRINEKSFKDAMDHIEQAAGGYESQLDKQSVFDGAKLVKNGYGWPHGNKGIEELFRLSRDLSNAEDLLIPISLTLNSVGDHWHAVSLLIRRGKDGLEYIFMDPLNWRFSGNDSYRRVIGSLKRLIENPKHFKESIIRSGFFTAESVTGLGKDFFAFPLFSYAEILENLELINDSFFTSKYKNATCQLIDDRLDGDAVRVELKLDLSGNNRRVVPDARAELKSRFGCE